MERDDATHPLISFIIPAHNEQPLIGRTLASIREAAAAVGLPYEAIVVDDASTDDTPRIAAASGATVVPVHHRRISAVRNAGYQHAQGHILVFIDADTILPAATLQAALETIADGAVGGGARLRFDRPLGPGARLLAALANLLGRLHHWSAGCFIFVRRQSLPPGDPFDERYFAGEEIVFSDRMKRIGRYVILPHHVITSGRKVERFGAWRVLWALACLAIRGQRSWQNPDAVRRWWYDRSTDTSDRCSDGPDPKGSSRQ